MRYWPSFPAGITAITTAFLSALVAVRADGDQRGGGKPPTPSFTREIQPILAGHCLKCHGSTTRKADLDLSNPAKMETGGVSGPAIERGASSKSLLYEQVSKQVMPPGKAEKLTGDQIRVIARWIDAGAPTDGAANESAPVAAPLHWAFRAPVKTARPVVKSASQSRTDVDAFIMARLEEKGLTLSPEAEKWKLIRRATFDLTGLPPAPGEIEAFLGDTTPDAYERLVDRLLASPAYGERWGRHWLDNAGYADTHGGDNDLGTIKENKDIWKYRDYVVRSLNADKPFDQFITEQLAGDEEVDWRNAASYEPGTLDALVATGFLRNVPDDTDEAELNRPLERNEIVGRVTESVAGNLLGLTFQCARCHNHKYDPVTQEDYYRLVACFTPVYDPGRWKLPAERSLPNVPPSAAEAIARHNAEIDRQIGEVRKPEVTARQAAEGRASSTRFATLPEALRGDLRGALSVPAEKRSEVQKYLAEKLGPLVEVKPADVERALSPADKATLKRVAEKSAALAAQKRLHGSFPAVWEDGSAPSATRILRRGDWAAPLASVAPGFPAALCQPGRNTAARPSEATGPSSGRRLALARWLTGRDHPLLARVVVNRIWQQHFGVGIVATPDNFGLKGAPPSHPRLLDWLAVDLIEHGWKLKRLHRMIMISAVYRQSSKRALAAEPSRAEALDPANELLGRASLRRLEAEPMRDAVLAVSGQLNRRLGGRPTPLVSHADGLVLVSAEDPAAADRRSLYIFARRNYPVGLLDVFDFPIMALNCTRRPTTATPLQSLAALNSEFVQDQSAIFARRVKSEAGARADQAARVERAFLLSLARRPSPAELRLCAQSLAEQTAAYRAEPAASEQPEDRALAGLCHMLFCSNEFLYIE
jgi:cytochrome c553